MSGTLPVQYSKIQIRRGPSTDLPGMPSGGGGNPTPGLDIGEFGYASDLGRLFIGLDPTSGLPQVMRQNFPYDNIEVITENSSDFLQTNFDAHVQDMQSGYFASDTFVYAPTSPTNVTINTVPFEISLPYNAGQALIYYFLYDPNSTPSGNPVKTGMLKITYTNGSLEPSVTDCGNTYQNYTGLTGGSDPNVAFGAIQFSAVASDGNVILQYLNSTSITPYMYFRIERASSGDDYGNEGGGGGGGGGGTTSQVTFSGDVTGSILFGAAEINSELTLASVGTAGTYTTVTVDTKGRVVSGSSSINGNATFSGQTGALTTIPISQVFGRTWHVDNFGAFGNTEQFVSNFSITSGHSTLTSSTNVFSSSMNGMTVLVPGAGANVTWPANGTFAGGTYPGYLIATITYVSPTQVTLSSPASATLTSAYCPITIGNDDSAAFVAALASLSTAGGGRLYISPLKRYLIAENQIVVPDFCGIYCENQPAYSSGVWSTTTGALVLAPVAPCSTANSGSAGSNFWNTERTVGAISLLRESFIENCYIISTGVWTTVTALDQEASIFGTQYGEVVSGNGIQLDGKCATVRNCIIIGFGRGIVNVPKFVDGSGNYVGGSGGFPHIESVVVDSGTCIEMGPNGTTVTIDDARNYALINPANLGGDMTCSFAAPISDGAGGCIISLTANTTTLGTQNPPVWTSGSNTIIGTPSPSNTTTLTVTLFDTNNNPVTSVGGTMTANRAVGVLVQNGSGYDLHLPHCPPTWNTWGAYSSSGVAQIGATGTVSTAAQFAVTSVVIRPGPSFYLNNAQFIHIRTPVITSGNGILANSTGGVRIENISADGMQDAATSTNGFMFSSINGTGDICISGGNANNFFGRISNTSVNGNWAFRIDNLSSDGPKVSTYQNGMNITETGGFLGKNGVVLTGPNSLGLSIGGGTVWATSDNDGGTVTVLQSNAAPPIYVDPSCIGAPNSLLPIYAQANYSIAPTSWTPSVGFSTLGNTSVTYISNTATYQVTGNVCYIQFEITFTPTYTSASGNFEITNLPKPPSMDAGLNLTGDTGTLTYPSGCTQASLLINSANGVIYVVGAGSGTTSTNFTTSQFISGGTYTISGSGVYLIT